MERKKNFLYFLERKRKTENKDYKKFMGQDKN